MKHFFFVLFSLILASTATAENLSATCLMSEQQQQDTILNEAPKALKSQSTSDCFQRLLKDELEHLSRNHSTLGKDRQGVIEDMLQTALREQQTQNIRAE